MQIRAVRLIHQLFAHQIRARAQLPGPHIERRFHEVPVRRPLPANPVMIEASSCLIESSVAGSNESTMVRAAFPAPPSAATSAWCMPHAESYLISR